MRDLALASGAGISSGSVLALLSRVLSVDPPSFVDCLPCPAAPSLCLSSFLLGISVGVVLLPAAELLWVLRAAVLRKLCRAFPTDPAYYRVL